MFLYDYYFLNIVFYDNVCGELNIIFAFLYNFFLDWLHNIFYIM